MTPLLRAVLLADLVDSTGFIERFGDARAASALQRLDLQIRDLLAFTGGRLIDKADGLLALFERPIQAVDFALRYQHLLRQFSARAGDGDSDGDGDGHGAGVGEAGQLQARVGIHVGELMTWHNDDAAVAAGAKPMEVEGLAKPIAARLMSLALPGQILISSLAQTLAQRAQAELGDRADSVRWMVHGRYRFKGVPAPLLVHEVGEVGKSPLRAPPSGQKSWRDIPLWRRPPVLAAQALVFVAVALFYGYAIFRSPPALGFQQRDWVVLGGISNFTGDPRLEDAMDSALRISLEQSRFVNLLPDMKVQEVLQRMGRSRQTVVDRALGSEIAVREGAKALFLPSVADDAGKIRVSVEVVDPSNQVTVFAESAEGSGPGSVMRSLDTINGKLRSRLGESASMIKANGVALSEATTPNLDALRAYSAAMASGRAGRYGEAMQLLNTAIEIDPQFAMAYANRAQLFSGVAGDNARAQADYRTAERFKSRMTLRERLVFETNRAQSLPPAQQMQPLQALSQLYPDMLGVHLRAAQVTWAYLQQYQQAASQLQPALRPQNPMLGSALSVAGVLDLAQEKYADAESDFSKARGAGGAVLVREHADVFAARRMFARASAILAEQQSSSLGASDLDGQVAELSYRLDRGDLQQALPVAQALQAQAAPLSSQVGRSLAVGALTIESYVAPQQAVKGFRTLVVSQRVIAADASHPDVFEARFASLYAASRLAALGDTGTARSLLAQLRRPIETSGYPTLVDLSCILQSELEIAAGHPNVAIALLAPRAAGSELFLVHAALLRAYRATGREADALDQARWLSTHRGRAYAEWNSGHMLQPANIIESNLALLSLAELSQRAGQVDQARSALARFDKAWASPPHFLAERLATLRSALAAKPGKGAVG